MPYDLQLTKAHKEHTFPKAVSTPGRLKPCPRSAVCTCWRISGAFGKVSNYREEVARMTDLSAVRAATTEAEVRATAEVARKHQCICATTLPSHTPMLRELLADEPEIRDRDAPPGGGDGSASG
jgi:hypothetical protein